MVTRKDLPRSAGTALADLSFGEAGGLSAKAILTAKLNSLIDERGHSQIAAAHISGMTQPKVPQVRRYKLRDISLKRLMPVLVSLDQQVKIVVRPGWPAHAAGITAVV